MKTKTQNRKINTETASKMLTNVSDLQRPENWASITRFAQAMKNGDWRLTHQGILIGPKGEVLDGQHRLRAIQIAGVEIEMPVTQILEATPMEIRQLFTAVDVNVPRKTGFILQTVHGMTNAIIKAGAVNAICALCLRSTYKLLPEATWDVYKLFAEEMDFALSQMQSGTRKLLTSPALGAFTMCLKADRQSADELLTGFTKGENIQKGFPAFALRERLLEPVKGVSKGFVNIKSMLVMTAMNAQMARQKIYLLKTSWNIVDVICDMIPDEVVQVKKIAGPAQSNAKRGFYRANEKNGTVTP